MIRDWAAYYHHHHYLISKSILLSLLTLFLPVPSTASGFTVASKIMKLYFLLDVCTHILSSVADAALIKIDDWHHQRIHLDDVQLHLRWAGSGPPLVLVHGFPQHSVCPHRAPQNRVSSQANSHLHS